MLPKSFEQYKFNEFVNNAIVDLGFSNPKSTIALFTNSLNLY